MKNLSQSFEYTGSSVYEINNTVDTTTGVALYDSRTGVGGIDYMPSDGDIVTVKAGGVATTDSEKLEPSLNNKVYYLVSDTVYTSEDKATILSLATEILVTYDSISGKYTGSFVFSNPNDYEYLYLIWDYANNLSSGTISYSGDADTKYIDIDLGTDVGNAGISYVASGKPSRFSLRWNDGIVADSGYIGLNSLANYNALIAAGVSSEDIKLQYPYDGLVDNGAGELKFNRLYPDVNDASLRVISPLNASSWSVDRIDPSLTSFYIDTDEAATIAEAGADIANTLYYHSGNNPLPELGDYIYINSDGSILFDGGDAFHLISTTLQTVPPVSGGTYIFINSLGEVIENGFVDCQETTVPFISQEDITVATGANVSIKLQASSNPTSWEINSDVRYYTITGGDDGSIYSYTDKKGVSQNITVSFGSSIDVAASAIPVLTFGDGTITTGSIAYAEIFPTGLSFDNRTGVISGTVDSSCGYSFEFIATNCFGNSSPKTILISAVQVDSIKPFAIDVENFGDTGDAACVITPIYSLLYHNGVDRVPKKGDVVFTDSQGLSPFMGGSMYYKIDHSTYSIKICENGEVCEAHECPVSTTTTTTTTSTTTTTTLPAGGLWYTATLCSDSLVSAVLYDSTSAAIVATNIVKTEDGNCWTITGTTTSSYPFQFIENPVVIYANCTTCLGITTTTTTTTTTTAPTYTSYDMGDVARATSYLACTNNPGVYVTFYHNGMSAKPIVGDFIFEDALGATPFDGSESWYYMPNAGDYSIRIASSGQVLNVVNCSGVTTTTTTTTIPTYYYSATKCTDGTTVKIKEQSFTLIANGTVVKGVSGQCYTIVANVASIATTDDILFTYSTCLECQGVTTTTTTSTTTTSTTTSSTTTTTTTTLPPLTEILVRRSTLLSGVCAGDITTRYVNSAVGEEGCKLYKWNGSAYVEDNNCYIVQLGTSNIWRWIIELHSFTSSGVCS